VVGVFVIGTVVTLAIASTDPSESAASSSAPAAAKAAPAALPTPADPVTPRSRERGEVSEALVARLGLDPGSIEPAGRLPLRAGDTLNVYLATRLEDHRQCQIQVDSTGAGGSCSHNLFATAPLHITMGTVGDDLRLVGVVRRRVARVEVIDATGAVREYQLEGSRSFLVEATLEEHRRTPPPVRVRAYDEHGRVLGAVPVPQFEPQR
jgi:hypothetical protein